MNDDELREMMESLTAALSKDGDPRATCLWWAGYLTMHFEMQRMKALGWKPSDGHW